MSKRLGKQTLKLKNPPTILQTAAIVGKKEGEGPLSDYFDYILTDDLWGEKSWEKSESKLQKEVILKVMEKSGTKSGDFDFILAGDLINQCISANYAVRDFPIPFLGLYGACSTMSESLMVGAMLTDGGFSKKALCLTSSHFCTAEKQFRFPLEYGGQRTPTSQWTVTGSGCAIVSETGNGPYITHLTPGKVIDIGIKDVNNMGAAMAPVDVKLTP